MIRVVRFTLLAGVLVALCQIGAHAQAAGAGQKPPDGKPAPRPQAPAQDARDAQPKPPDANLPELTAEQKAFNAIAEEKDAQKRVPMYEQFIQQNPKAVDLVSLARREIQRTSLDTLKSSSAKYLDIVNREIEAAKSAANPTQLPSVYSRFAAEMLTAGVLLDQAEEYARQSVALLDERKYVEYQKEADQQTAEMFAKRAATPPPAGQPAVAMPAGISIRTVNGAPTVQPLPPRPPSTSPAPSAPPPPPRARTEEQLRSAFKAMRASNLATLGRLLVKRNKTTEGETLLEEAYALGPPASTRATIARVLAESAKKAGKESAQVEYLTVLALGGQITADEQKDFEALYRKSHNGSLDGLDAMLDARFASENPKFAVTPVNRKTTPNQRAVLAENFTGSG